LHSETPRQEEIETYEMLHQLCIQNKKCIKTCKHIQTIHGRKNYSSTNLEMPIQGVYKGWTVTSLGSLSIPLYSGLPSYFSP
jgi:hypothetical protein